MEGVIMRLRGIVRRIDHLGRLVLPKEIRKAYFIDKGDPMEIIPMEEGILLRKHDTTENFSLHMDYLVELVRANKEDLDEKKIKEICEKLDEVKKVFNN